MCKEKLTLVAVVAAIFAVTASHLTVPPYWDALWYYSDLMTTVLRPFSWVALGLGHVCTAYLLPHAVLQRLDPGNVWMLNLVEVGYGIVALIAFYRILRRLFPGEDLTAERCAMTVIFGVYPPFLAMMFSMSPDHGVMVFLLCYLAALLERRVVLAAAFGLCLSFSKQTGASLTLAIGILYQVMVVLQSPGVWAERRHVLKRHGWLWLPTCFYLLYLKFAFDPAAGQASAWEILRERQPSLSLLGLALDFDLREAHYRAYLVDIFIAQFNWLLSLPLVVLLVSKVRGWLKAKPWHAAARMPQYAAFVWLSAAAALYAVTRFRQWDNLRYVLPAFPLLMLVSYDALYRTVRNGRARLAFLVCCALAFAASVHRTIDPVSRKLYGTFPFGELGMLKRPHWDITADPVVYNLEFLKVHDLFNDVTAFVKPDDDTWIFSNYMNCFRFPGLIDRETFQRTLRPDRGFTLKMNCWENGAFELAMARPNPRLYFLDFPNKPDQKLLHRLEREAKRTESRRFYTDGYDAVLHTFVKKAPTP